MIKTICIKIDPVSKEKHSIVLYLQHGLCDVTRKPSILRPSCVDLSCVAKRLKTCIRLRANLSSIKVDASLEREGSKEAPQKSSEVF